MQKQYQKKCLKNGLTEDQINKARAILKQVNVSAICKEKNVRVSTIYNVLRDESPKVDDLKKVLIVANRQVKKKQDTLEALPL